MNQTAADDDILLELRRVDLDVDGAPVARALSFRVRRGQTVCLLGPSGCGKTTTLRAVAGFQPVASGEILLNDQVVSSPDWLTPPEQRRLGMVFQDHALFPHLNVADNVTFGLRKLGRGQRETRAREMLALVQLDGMEERFPHELSGGQQQRVALARALAPEPELVLLDEPFSSLDVDLREGLANQVHEIFRERGVTAVLVTHDQNEAFAMADQIGIMRGGQIVQWDTPYNLYHEPLDRFVADFIGHGRFIRGRLLDHDLLDTEVGVIRGNRAYGWPAGTEVDVLLRPDDVLPAPESELRGWVVKKAFTGAETIYTLRLDSGAELLSLFPSHHDHAINEQVGIHIDAQHLVAFPRDDGHAAGED